MPELAVKQAFIFRIATVPAGACPIRIPLSLLFCNRGVVFRCLASHQPRLVSCPAEGSCNSFVLARINVLFTEAFQPQDVDRGREGNRRALQRALAERGLRVRDQRGNASRQALVTQNFESHTATFPGPPFFERSGLAGAAMGAIAEMNEGCIMTEREVPNC